MARQPDLSQILGNDFEAAWELDLTGVDGKHAQAAIDRMLERSRFGEAKTVLIRLELATEEGRETLFQPVGRHLLAAMRRGLVTRCRPVSRRGVGGFYVELAGRRGAQG